MLISKDIKFYLECLEYADLVEEAMEFLVNNHPKLVRIALDVVSKKADAGDVKYQTLYLLYSIKFEVKEKQLQDLALLKELFDVAGSPHDVLPFLETSVEYAKYIVHKIMSDITIWEKDLVDYLNYLCSFKDSSYNFYDSLRRKVLATRMIAHLTEESVNTTIEGLESNFYIRIDSVLEN